MKIDRQDISWFIKNIKSNYPEATDDEFVEHLCKYMEVNPACVDINGVSRKGRYAYSTVGYGVYSLLGERYRMGRIEVFDLECESGYAIHEGIYTMPFESANQFEDFIDSLQTDLPINIEIGSHEWCSRECAKDLGVEPDKMNDAETKKAFYKVKNDKWAVEQGYEDYDAYLDSTPFGKKKYKNNEGG